MNKDWKDKLESWKKEHQKKLIDEQGKTHLGSYPRIKYGEEEADWEADKYECHDCSATKGQIHLLGCDVEQCPVCKEQLISCEHFYGLKPKFSYLGNNQLFYKPAKKEYFIKFLRIIGYSNETKRDLVLSKNKKSKDWMLYCDKVLIGEELVQAIERILRDTFGLKEIFDIHVSDEMESAKNKEGKELLRVVVSVSVKYEEVKSDSFPHNYTEWISQEALEERILKREKEIAI